jgi:hypothetical protein
MSAVRWRIGCQCGSLADKTSVWSGGGQDGCGSLADRMPVVRWRTGCPRSESDLAHMEEVAGWAI